MGLDKLRAHVNKVATDITTNTLDELQENAPVDTGRLRNSFVVNVGAVPYAGDADAEGINALNQHSGLNGYKAEDGPINITNSTDYASIVNRTHKTHKGFIERSIKNGVNRT